MTARARRAPSNTPPRRIVVGADSSYWGRLALRWAAEHAWLAGARLEVHVPPGEDDQVRLLEHNFATLPITAVPGTRAADGLLVASKQADLVVLGCRGEDHQGIGLGATVTPVASRAECDVMVIGGAPAAVRGVHHRVAVLLGSHEDEHALHSAARLAALRHAPLHILIAAPMMGTHPIRSQTESYQVDLAAARELVRVLEPSVATTVELVRTSPHEAISGATDVDVLVIGVRPRPDARLDAVVRSALHHAPSPVLIARGTAVSTAAAGGRELTRSYRG